MEYLVSNSLFFPSLENVHLVIVDLVELFAENLDQQMAIDSDLASFEFPQRMRELLLWFSECFLFDLLF